MNGIQTPENGNFQIWISTGYFIVKPLNKNINRNSVNNSEIIILVFVFDDKWFHL